MPFFVYERKMCLLQNYRRKENPTVVKSGVLNIFHAFLVNINGYGAATSAL